MLMLDRLADALEYPEDGSAELKERYVDTFDLDPACSLEIGWHLFGESPERGVFLAMLREDLRRAGVDERGSLPDYLPTLLRLMAREDDEAVAALALIIRPALMSILETLKTRANPYADAITAVVDTLDMRCHLEEQP